MPFKSRSQRKWMWAKHPEMARRWQAETPKGKLPEKVKQEKIAGFFDELKKIQKHAMAEDTQAQARNNFNKSSKVGLLGSKKPPEPNIRAVATKV